MQVFTYFDLSIPILLAAFSLCTSMLAVLGTVQLVVSPPQPQPQPQHAAALEVGLGMQKRSASASAAAAPGLAALPWYSVSPTDSRFVPLDARPPLSMAKLIMLRHAETQRRANARARMRQAHLTYAY